MLQSSTLSTEGRPIQFQPDLSQNGGSQNTSSRPVIVKGSDKTSQQTIDARKSVYAFQPPTADILKQVNNLAEVLEDVANSTADELKEYINNMRQSETSNGVVDDPDLLDSALHGLYQELSRTNFSGFSFRNVLDHFCKGQPLKLFDRPLLRAMVTLCEDKNNQGMTIGEMLAKAGSQPLKNSKTVNELLKYKANGARHLFEQGQPVTTSETMRNSTHKTGLGMALVAAAGGAAMLPTAAGSSAFYCTKGYEEMCIIRARGGDGGDRVSENCLRNDCTLVDSVNVTTCEIICAPTNAPAISSTNAPAISSTNAPAISSTNAPAISSTNAPANASTNASTCATKYEITCVPVNAQNCAPICETTKASTNALTYAPTNALTCPPINAQTCAPVCETSEAPITNAITTNAQGVTASCVVWGPCVLTGIACFVAGSYITSLVYNREVRHEKGYRAWLAKPVKDLAKPMKDLAKSICPSSLETCCSGTGEYRVATLEDQIEARDEANFRTALRNQATGEPGAAELDETEMLDLWKKNRQSNKASRHEGDKKSSYDLWHTGQSS